MRDPLQTSTETEKQSGRIPFSQQAWTLDTMKVHFDSRLEDLRRYFSDILQVQEQTNRDRFTAAEKGVQTAFIAADKAVQAAMAASEKAVLKAENAAEKRAEASNEIRAAMVDQQRTFADRNGTDMQFKALSERTTEIKDTVTARIDGVEKKLDAMLNKVIGFGLLITFIVGIIAIFGGLIGGNGQ